jgi:hypothetical protein
MRWLARLRLVGARHPWLRWGLIALPALLVALTVATTTADLDQRRRAWGELSPVVVARHSLAPGDTMSLDDVIVEDRPVALIPLDALHDPSTLGADTRVWQWVGAGEVVTSHDVTGRASPSARLPPGTRGLVVGSGGLPVAVGDVVELVVDAEPLGTATVIEVMAPRNDSAPGNAVVRPLLIAAPAVGAARLAWAVAEGRVTVLLTDARTQRQPAANTTTMSEANPTR